MKTGQTLQKTKHNKTHTHATIRHRVLGVDTAPMKGILRLTNSCLGLTFCFSLLTKMLVSELLSLGVFLDLSIWPYKGLGSRL